MQVHQVVVMEVPRYEIDPRKGATMRRERVLTPGSASVISDSEHGEFAADASGTFDVPEGLAGTLLCQPGWFEGPNPFPPAAAVEEPVQAASKVEPVSAQGPPAIPVT